MEQPLEMVLQEHEQMVLNAIFADCLYYQKAVVSHQDGQRIRLEAVLETKQGFVDLEVFYKVDHQNTVRLENPEYTLMKPFLIYQCIREGKIQGWRTARKGEDAYTLIMEIAARWLDLESQVEKWHRHQPAQ